jgi:hypothetical protein
MANNSSLRITMINDYDELSKEELYEAEFYEKEPGKKTFKKN